MTLQMVKLLLVTLMKISPTLLGSSGRRQEWKIRSS